MADPEPAEYNGIHLLIKAGSASKTKLLALDFLSYCAMGGQPGTMKSSLSFLMAASKHSEHIHSSLGTLQDARVLLRDKATTGTVEKDSPKQPSTTTQQLSSSVRKPSVIPERKSSVVFEQNEQPFLQQESPPEEQSLVQKISPEEYQSAWEMKQTYERIINELQGRQLEASNWTEGIAAIARQFEQQIGTLELQNKLLEQERQQREEMQKDREALATRELREQADRATSQARDLAVKIEGIVRQNIRATLLEEEAKREMLLAHEREVRDALRLTHRSFLDEKRRQMKLQVRQGVIQHWHNQLALQSEELYNDLWNEKRRIALEKVEASQNALQFKIAKEEAEERACSAQAAEQRQRENENKEAFFQLGQKERDELRKAAVHVKEQATELRNKLTLWTTWLTETDSGMPKV